MSLRRESGEVGRGGWVSGNSRELNVRGPGDLAEMLRVSGEGVVGASGVGTSRVPQQLQKKKKSACKTEDAGNAVGSIPGLGRCLRGGPGNPLQDSCLENPKDRGAWRGCSPWGCKVRLTTEQEHVQGLEHVKG